VTSPLRDQNNAMGQLLTRAKQGGELSRPGARERVWKKLQGPPRIRPAWGWVPAGAAVAVLGALLFFRVTAKQSLEPAEPFATVTLASGDVQASNDSAGATWSTARAGQGLREGAQLKVASKSRAYTRLKGAGALFREGTRASLSRKQLSLDDGIVVAAAKARLRAKAKEYSVEVDSAVFQLETAADAVTLQVSDGQAVVRGPGTSVVVHAGESWSSRVGKAKASIAPADLATARALASPAGEEVVLRIATPVGAHVTLDGVELGTAPLEVVASRAPHQLGSVQGSLRSSLTVKPSIGGVTIVELPRPEPLPLPDVTFEQQLEPEPDPHPTARVEPPADPGKRYLLARALAQRGRSGEALAIYEGLAKGDSGWAEPSLYEVGRLDLRALKNPHAALEALEAYRARWPNGSLAHEVALSSIEVQLRLGAGTAALQAMDDFLSRFPSSERRAEVLFLRATVRRDRGDCAGAAADYLSLTDDAVHADDALYFAAVCEQQLGEEASARRHLSEYLQQFPAGAHRDEVQRFFEGGPPSGNSRAP
jgi:hypothetical protein